MRLDLCSLMGICGAYYYELTIWIRCVSVRKALADESRVADNTRTSLLVRFNLLLLYSVLSITPDCYLHGKIFHPGARYY